METRIKEVICTVTMNINIFSHLLAAAEQNPPSFTVKDGGEVTLPCGNVTDGHQKCVHTTWVFSVSSNAYARRLIELGQIVELARGKSDRLSVTENCSLVIKKVTVEDVGRYTCRQFNKSGQHQGPDSEVLLSVVTSEYLHHNVFSSNCETLQ